MVLLLHSLAVRGVCRTGLIIESGYKGQMSGFEGVFVICSSHHGDKNLLRSVTEGAPVAVPGLAPEGRPS